MIFSLLKVKQPFFMSSAKSRPYNLVKDQNASLGYCLSKSNAIFC